MSERKVINKYYPPDFDPAKLNRVRKTKKSAAASLDTVRLMAPFSMRCTTCGEFIYRGRKFNARKQVLDENYLGIRMIRFYIRCTRCSGEIRFRTDPKLADYVAESGAVRNSEPWRDRQGEQESVEERLDRLEREEHEQAEREAAAVNGTTVVDPNVDRIQELEVKVAAARREMEVQDELDELRSRNARIDTSNLDLVAKAESALHHSETAHRLQEEQADEEAARLAFRTAAGNPIRRLVQDEPTKSSSAVTQPTSTPAATRSIVHKIIRRPNDMNAKRIV